MVRARCLSLALAAGWAAAAMALDVEPVCAAGGAGCAGDVGDEVAHLQVGSKSQAEVARHGIIPLSCGGGKEAPSCDQCPPGQCGGECEWVQESTWHGSTAGCVDKLPPPTVNLPTPTRVVCAGGTTASCCAACPQCGGDCKWVTEETWHVSQSKSGCVLREGTCNVGDSVQCPGSDNACAGNQCCPGVNGSDTFPCPSADSTWSATGCGIKQKVVDCL